MSNLRSFKSGRSSGFGGKSTSDRRRRWGHARGLVAVSAATVMTLSLAACGGGSNDTGSNDTGSKGLTKVDFAVTGKVVQNVHLAVAEDEGFFKKHGLDVSLVMTSGGPTTASALISGSVPLAESGISGIWPALKEGENIANLFGGEKMNYGIAVQPDVPTPHAGEPFPKPLLDLKGKTIGVTAIGGATQRFAVTLLKEAGLKASEVSFIANGVPPASVVSFKEKQVDALVTFPPVPLQLGEEGKDFKVVADAAAGTAGHTYDSYLINTIAANSTFVKEHPDTVLNFCKSMADATRFSLDPKNSQIMGKILGKHTGVKADEGVTIWKAQKNTFEPVLTKELWAAQAKFAREDLQDFVPSFDKFVYAPCQNLDWGS